MTVSEGYKYIKRVVCVDTGGYTASLELDAVYKILPDNVSGKHKLIRVIDESGEDYLYPESYFAPAEAVVNRPGIAERIKAGIRWLNEDDHLALGCIFSFLWPLFLVIAVFFMLPGYGTFKIWRWLGEWAEQ